MSARRHTPRSGPPALVDLPAGRGGAAHALRHRTWSPEPAREDPSPPTKSDSIRRSASFAAPLRESFFDLAQRYAKLRQSAFKSKSGRAKKALPPPARVARERRLTDLPPPLPMEESVSQAIYADSFVSEAPEEATLVQPLARRHSEPPPPASERRAFATLRPPPPPDPLPRLLPSTMPPPPVALATLPPPPPAPPSIWRPMLATAVMSATIGAIVSVSLWVVRSATVQPPLRPTVVATAARLSAPPLAPCPIPTAFAGSTANVSSVSTAARSAPASVSLETLPVETTSPRALTSPVLRAPAAAALVAPRARASTSHAAAGSRAADAEQPVAASVVATEPEHRSKRSHKSAASDDDTGSAAAPPPAPTAGPDRAAIARAVGRAAGAASSCDSGPQRGRALLTFAPSGNVQSVQLIEPFSDNSVNGCVLRALGRAHVAPFAGDPVQVRKGLSW